MGSDIKLIPIFKSKRKTFSHSSYKDSKHEKTAYFLPAISSRLKTKAFLQTNMGWSFHIQYFIPVGHWKETFSMCRICISEKRETYPQEKVFQAFQHEYNYVIFGLP